MRAEDEVRANLLALDAGPDPEFLAGVAAAPESGPGNPALLRPAGEQPSLHDPCMKALVIDRPGWQKPVTGEVVAWLRERECTAEQFGVSGGVAFLSTTPVSVSSTDLRRQLAQGMPAKYLVPEPVGDYIRAHQLYLSIN